MVTMAMGLWGYGAKCVTGPKTAEVHVLFRGILVVPSAGGHGNLRQHGFDRFGGRQRVAGAGQIPWVW